jgi:hypothetical protein
MLYFEENCESDLQNSSPPQNLTPHHRTLEVRPRLRFYGTPVLKYVQSSDDIKLRWLAEGLSQEHEDQCEDMEGGCWDPIVCVNCLKLPVSTWRTT